MTMNPQNSATNRLRTNRHPFIDFEITISGRYGNGRVEIVSVYWRMRYDKRLYGL